MSTSREIGKGPWLKGRLTREMIDQVFAVIDSHSDGVTSGILAAKLYDKWEPPPDCGSDRRLDAALQRLRRAGKIQCFGMSWYAARQGK